MVANQITQKNRVHLNHKGAVMWITGLPCSGKTTLSEKLRLSLCHKKILTYVIDGDQIRKGLSSDLGFLKDDRSENIRRVGEVAKLFSDVGFVVIASLISPFRKDRDKVRNNLGSDRFVEIYLDCPIEECEKRDVKGHYKSARQGKIKDFTGVSSPYEPPLNPELSLRTSTDNIESCVDKVISYLVKFSHISLES